MYQENYYGSDVNCNCLDDEDSFGNYEDSGRVYDSLFGLGNKKKQAERKVKRAARKLRKGKTKAAARLTSKAGKILSKIEQGQTAVKGAQSSLSNINATQQVIDAGVPEQTESIYTEPGQIGSESGSTTMSRGLAQSQTMAGSGGDISGGGGGGDSMEDIYSSGTGVETSTALQPKELSGVTVSAKKKNWLIIGGIILVAIVVVVVLIKFSKKK